MSSAADWDERYRRGAHLVAEPDPFLVQSKAYWPAAPGAALDVACGAGAGAAFLAEHGFHTTAVDFSAEALRVTRELAVSRGVEVETLRQSLESPDIDLGKNRYDLVSVFRFLYRPLFPILQRAVRPGGLIVYKTYTLEQMQFEGGPRNPEFLLKPNELLGVFRHWRVLRYEEEERGRGTAALIARKP